MQISRAAPAKINLALHVTGRRDDGYHLLDSLVVFARFGDTISVEPAVSDRLEVIGPFAADVPDDAGNLVLRSRNLLRSLAPDRSSPVAIRLDKQLPVASGIGGGSSDAAATLKALMELWQLEINSGQLQEASLSLGADLPMCLTACPLIAQGIGEVLEPVSDFPRLPIVLVNPGVAVSTPEMFRALTRRDNAPLPGLPQRRDIAKIAAWLTSTRNDLELPAISRAPLIADALDELRDHACLIARMSGSGATCYGLFTDSDQAERAARDIATRHPGWFVVATETLLPEDKNGRN